MDEKAMITTPTDKADLLARIYDEWQALMQAVEKLTPEQMSVPRSGGWSVKDNLAHLADWEQFLLSHHLGGRPAYEVMQIDAATYKSLDEDGINAVLYERNKERSVEEVLARSRQIHDQVETTLKEMSFADLLRQRFDDDPEKRPVLAWVIGNTYEHYREHRQNILSG